MPAAPKSSVTKKVGAPKAKGAVRAKSGCYTCRIRRKKCDEQHNDQGHCQTCVRLRLQCLGFGAKRPDWLRESQTVGELREKIKVFLASQGMIKGHSGSGARPSEQEPPMLRLVDSAGYSSASESPPAQTLSLSSDAGTRHHTSDSRDQAWVMGDQQHYSHIGLPTSSPHMRDESPPYGSNRQSSIDDPYNTHDSVAFGPLSPSAVAHLTFHSPAKGSHFYGYSNNITIEEEYDAPYIQNTLMRNPEPYIDEIVGGGLQAYYMEHVVNHQYLLADWRTANMIFATFGHEFSGEAVRLLASVHIARLQRPAERALAHNDVRVRLESLGRLLSTGGHSTDDAMAALHVVSSFLFDGGQGPWDQWLHLARVYVQGLFLKTGSPAYLLSQCNSKVAFVIKTTIWFDVLASVTTQDAPYLLSDIRDMFSPTGSGIRDINNTSDTNMMTVMGCENTTVWALAETAALCVWKRNQLTRGSLSMHDLVEKANVIAAHLQPVQSATPYNDPITLGRYHAAEIFRASTLLYLRSVVSGDFPNVHDIQESVKETIRCIKDVPDGPEQRVSGAVVRSTVFSIFICGCLASEQQHKEILLRQLTRENGKSGNCSSVQNLLREIWLRQQGVPKDKPVPWRDMLRRSKILLV